jgi:hypothetical protein
MNTTTGVRLMPHAERRNLLGFAATVYEAKW